MLNVKVDYQLIAPFERFRAKKMKKKILSHLIWMYLRCISPLHVPQFRQLNGMTKVRTYVT